MNLHGNWNFINGNETKLSDEEIIGKVFELNTFVMPGTTNENKIGEKLDESKFDPKEKVKCLREHYNFLGVMWYQKEVFLDDEIANTDFELFLERVVFESKVYVNGKFVGRNSSLSVPHRYQVGDYLVNGKNLITIRIDNTDVEGIGAFSSAMTVDTSTVWNGIVGKIELRKQPKIDVENVKIFPNLDKEEVRISFKGKNTNNESNNTLLTFKAETSDKRHEVLSTNISINHEDDYEVIYPMSSFKKWDEHTPNVYTMQITVGGFEKEVKFGMREITTKNNQILINGLPTFFMGTLECCIFPLTGYPPTTRPYWDKIFNKLIEYGLNHIRFHSWCPPEIAFDVADELGVYVQAEAPFWIDRWQGMVVGDDKRHYDFLPKENKRIIDEFGNHPSFVLFSNGNELTGDFQLMEDAIKHVKKDDSRFLYTLTSNWDRPINKEDDFFIAQTVDSIGIRGQYFHNEMASATNLEFSNGISRRDVPTITHEVGQYTIFPKISEIEKYTGLLEPTNLKYIKSQLEKNGVLDLAEEYTINSGKTSAMLYRDEIESALRTKNIGGIQLLDLHDFPGQSTADVGVLDCFWDEKGIIEAKRFREFSNRVVPLLEMPKRVFTCDEDMDFGLKIANYSDKEIQNQQVSFIIKSDEEVLYESSIILESIKQGNSYHYYDFCGTIPSVIKPEILECVVELKGTEYVNRWNIYVYPKQEVESYNFFTEINEEFLKAIEKGENILFNPPLERVKNSLNGCFFPVFWSPVHFTSESPNGMIVPKNHPIFNHFNTGDFADYQWRSLLDNSVNLKLTNTKITPIIDVIPNFFVAERLTNLFEVKIGNANVVVALMDITNNMEYRIEATALRNSIINYLKMDVHEVETTLSISEFEEMFYKKGEVVNKSKLRGVELGKSKPVNVSSEHDDHPGYHGNNGLNYTFWCAADNNIGHSYEIDLGQDRLIYGTKIMFEKNANYLYAILTSYDGVNYKTVVNQTGQTSTSRVREDIFTSKARYVKIVYNGLPSDTRAGHNYFEIYGE